MSIYVFLYLLISVNVIATDFDWFSALNDLQQTQAIWGTTGVNSYVFKINITSPTLPFPCNIAPKYVLVKNHVVQYVEYDSQYLQSQNVNCQDQPVNIAQYETIDGYYEMAKQWADEGIQDNCDSTVPSEADTCGGSILFEHNDVLHYPTKLRFILPQVGNQYPLYTFPCLTVYDSSPEIHNFGNDCTEFIPPQPTVSPTPCSEQCKTAQDECGFNDKCCTGLCGISQWDTSKLVCCYDDSVDDGLCRNDFDCCDGYTCDGDSNLCIQKHICGTPRNSGWNKLIKCRWNNDCCEGYTCNVWKRKCLPRQLDSSTNNGGNTLNYFNIFIALLISLIISLLINVCLCVNCISKEKSKCVRKYEINDYETDEERIDLKI